MNEDEKTIWERHRDKRFKERDERLKNWRKIRLDALKKYGGSLNPQRK